LNKTKYIGRSEVGSTGNTGKYEEKRGEGPTKYRSEGLCTLATRTLNKRGGALPRPLIPNLPD
jgi:hypothetical protein